MCRTAEQISSLTLSESGSNIRKGKETLREIFSQKGATKELAQTNYVGSDNIKPIRSNIGGATPKSLTPGFKSKMITPISHRHIGK